MLAPRQQGPGLRGAHQTQSRARREAFAKPPAAPGIVEQRQHIGQQRFGQVHAAHLALQIQQIDGAEPTGQLRQRAAPLPEAQQRPLSLGIRITQADAQQETVELRFWQGKGARLTGRVLGGDDEEGLGQPVTDTIHADLAFLHGFQQRALGAWCRPVDLIGQHQLGKDRPRMEGEPTTDAVIDGGAGDVGRQHIAGELDALEFQPQAACQRMGQGGLAHTGHVFQQ
jgi:hypothetical protein